MTDYSDLIESEGPDIFETLSSVNVNEWTEEKGKPPYKFTYLSWVFALTEVKKRYPETTWKVSKFHETSAMYVDDKLVRTERTLPFMRDNQGYTMVEVNVTIDGLTLPEVYPVLDYMNKSVQNPNSFQVNTAIKRAITKCFANFGLGLYLYAGEDLPRISETRIDGSVPKNEEGTVTQYVKMDRLIRNKVFSPEETEGYKDWMYPKPPVDHPSKTECDEKLMILKNIIKERKSNVTRSNNK